MTTTLTLPSPPDLTGQGEEATARLEKWQKQLARQRGENAALFATAQQAYDRAKAEHDRFEAHIDEQLAAPPDFESVPNDQAVNMLGDWLLMVARKCGGPALEHALGAGWPGTAELRRLIPAHTIEMARNEAAQLAGEVWAREAKAKGEWGV